ncbi:hypothetical protein [Neosynechococcus sphagnicola]|uniref:hypothetical protein n=1 Tax=Neosynechococcus sphagnicola TaxID=1501145 RepID=UPI000A7DA6CB|nr:hypothetical protein [Neosynechococcus sphagnicola]
MDPLFWLGLSILLVAASLSAVLVAALPTLQELARAARSAEKLFDTLARELPPTLEAIRLTGLEISDLTDDISEGVKSAGEVVKQVDQSLLGAKKQAQRVQVNTRSVLVGVRAAWKNFTRKPSTPGQRRDRLPAASQSVVEQRSTYPEPSYYPASSDWGNSPPPLVAPEIASPPDDPNQLRD